MGSNNIWTSLRDDEELQEEDVLWGTNSDNYSREKMKIPKSNTRKQQSRIMHQQQSSSSAPVKNVVDDWSKIYGTKTPQKTTNNYSWDLSDEDDDDDDDDDNAIPPHEWIARKLAKSRISSASVCEGAGRTLKGRDLSRVRNAVLTKTGFLESKSSHHY